jgi:DNA-binding SARP family transcriptional activator
MSDRNDEGLATAATAQSVATEQGMTLWTFLANSAGVDIHLAQGDLDGAAPYLARLEQLLTPRRRIDQGHYVFYGAWTASLRGDYAAAKDKLFDCLALVGRGDNLQNCAVNLALAALHQKTEDPETALRHAQCALTLGAALRSPMMQYEALRLLAWIHLEQGRETEGLVYLSQAFALGRAKSFARLRYYFNDPGVFAKLCAFALEANLEVDYALALIREHKLLPPAAAPVAESWPLPVRIYTLGRFSLLRDGNAVTFAGKAQKKPLDLLKALIALGGRDVREDTLAGALWPDADGDDAAHSLTSTVHRLRTLMGPDAIVRQAGRLSLDPRQCWVDAWSFARGLTLLKQAERAQKLADSGSLGERLMQQYRGGFLANDVEHPWILQARERLHARFLRLLEATGAAHARAQRHELASACFQKAVEIDPLAEPAYRGLMQVSLIQGRHAEALATYKRCRKALRSGLGCAPSTETQALFSTLRGQPGRRREVPSR